MSLLNSLKPEYRNAIVATRQYVEPPAKTPAHIKARMVACMTAYCEKRSLTPFEERVYQADATIFQASRPRPVIAVKKQIAAKPPVVPTIDRRHGELALRYPKMPYDVIKRCVANGYSEDVCNALYIAELSKSLRGVATYGDMNVAGPRSEDGGQVSDAQQTLRDDDEDDIYPEASDHSRAAAWHRAAAAKAKTLEEGCAHHKCADLHDEAARLYPDLNSRLAAEAASKSLQHAQNGL